MRTAFEVSRRRFLKHSALGGGGLVIGFTLHGASRLAETATQFRPNALLRVAPDDCVTVICGLSELSQGVRTAIAMFVTEELDADWTKSASSRRSRRRFTPTPSSAPGRPAARPRCARARHRCARPAPRRARWGGPLPTGVRRGIAVAQSFGSYVAQVAEVSVSDAGQITVRRVGAAVDCAPVVNPAIVARQTESAIVYGLSALLYGRISFRDGKVDQANFDSYRVLRMNEMPKVEVHIVPSSEAPGGMGDLGLPPLAPAVTSAIFGATGKRLRRLPIDPAELRKA